MPLQLFGDFGLSAGFDQPADQYQNSQLCINYYPEISPSQTAKEPAALLGTPGLLGLDTIVEVTPIIYKDDWQGNQLQYITSRTNNIHSTDMSTWSKYGASGDPLVTTGQSDPSGGTGAILVHFTNGNSQEVYIAQTNSTNATYSIWLKGVVGGEYVSFSDNGETGAMGPLTTSWAPYQVSKNPDSSDGFASLSNNAGAYATESIYAFAPQAEPTGTTATSFIANTTGSPLSVIDYTVGAEIVHISFGIAPESGSTIYQQNSSGSYIEIGTGDGSTIKFTLDHAITFPVPVLGTSWAMPSAVTDQQVRGLWVLPGRTQAIAVIKDQCYIVTYTQPDKSVTPTISIAQKSVGTLLTTAGQVRIRDNGLGGVAVIVDGPYGYYYVYGTAGSVVGPVGTFVQITDPNFLGSFNVAFIDGWWVFQQPFTQKFYTNSAPYSTTFDATYYAYKDSFSDNLVALYESKEELWLIGEETTEIWYDAGGQYFPFQRLIGTLLQVGCKAPYSVARFNAGGQDGLIWLGRSDRGENVVVQTSGFNAEVVSTPAVSNAITQLTYQEDAFGYTYQYDGHEFYVLTFPTADVTWVYDGTLPPAMAWHQRPSYDPYAQQFHRNRSNAYMQFAGMRIVGDYQNGTLYQLTRNAYSDAAWPLIAIRRSPFVWDQSRTRVFTASLQVDFAPGVGNNSGTWTNPQAQLRTSKDYGTTFGQPRLAALGQTGNYLNRCMWRQLGFSRATVAEIQVIDPVRRDIVGATIRSFDETAGGNL